MKKLKVKMIQMVNGEFAECLNCKRAMIKRLMSWGYLWACAFCGTAMDKNGIPYR